MLRLFDTTTPGSTTTTAITGLGAGEEVRGIDVRPATGKVFLITVTDGSAFNSAMKTYTLDPASGVATLVGATAGLIPGAGDLPSGWDFNPTSDRVRFVNANDENLRINPINGALVNDDTDLAPAATTELIGAAHDRNHVGATLTTLFAINRAGSSLVRQGAVDGEPNPNGGVVTAVNALGFTLHAVRDGGFDISPTGVAYAALTDAASPPPGSTRSTWRPAPRPRWA